MLNFFKQSFVNHLTPLILVLMLLILITVILSNLNQDNTVKFYDDQSFSDTENLRIVNIKNRKEETKHNVSEYQPDITQMLKDGIGAWNTGKVSEAEDHFRTVMIFQNNNPIALLYLGLIFTHQGRYVEAEYITRLRTTLYPHDMNAHLQLSSLYLRLQHVKQALAVGKKAFRLNPESGEAALNLARIYANAGERGLMLYYLRLALQHRTRPSREISWDPAFDEYRHLPEFQNVFRTSSQERGGQK